MYAMVPASIRVGFLALLVASCTATPENGNLDHEFAGVVAVTNKPYLIMRNGGALDIAVSWDSADDAPVQVVQGALSNAQPGQISPFGGLLLRDLQALRLAHYQGSVSSSPVCLIQ